LLLHMKLKIKKSTFYYKTVSLGEAGKYSVQAEILFVVNISIRFFHSKREQLIL